MEYIQVGAEVMFKAGLLGMVWQSIKWCKLLNERFDSLRKVVDAQNSYARESVYEYQKRQLVSEGSVKAVLETAIDLRHKIDKLQKAFKDEIVDAHTGIIATCADARKSALECVKICKDFEERQVELQYHIEGQMDLWSEKLLGKIIRNRRKPGPKKKRVTKKEEVTL